MKNSKNIYLLFLAIFMVFWNPLSYSIFYSGTEMKESQLFKLLFWILPLCCMLLMYLIFRKKSINERWLNFIFGISFSGILMGVLVLINVCLGLFIQNNVSKAETQKTVGLLFEPNTVAHYQTTEFNYKAEINSLGLRNKEINIQKEDSCFRILCLGDSWTYGWGVDIEDSWPVQLETFLHKHGYSKVEVINCGRPGQYTTTHKNNLTKLVPLLNPDLVLLGVLQLDDLAQLYENTYFLKNTEHKKTITKTGFQAYLRNFMYSLVNASFSNYVSLLKNNKLSKGSNKEIEIKEDWASSSNKMIENFNALQQLRFSTFPDTIQTLFKTGNLNPSLLEIYLFYPDRLPIFNNPANPATKFALQQMDGDLKEMETFCEKYKVKIIFLNLPINDFTGHTVMRSASDILTPFWVSNNKIDSMYRSLALKNKLPYFELTETFCSLKNKENYFFLFDGHPNRNGYAEIANAVGDFLTQHNFVEP